MSRRMPSISPLRSSMHVFAPEGSLANVGGWQALATGSRIAEARLRRAAAERGVARAYDTSPERGHAQGRALGGSGVNDRLLTTRQVAEYLGFSPETVLRRYRAGELVGIRLASNVLRFRASDVEAWLEGRSSLRRLPS